MIPGGLAEGLPDDLFDPEQLAMGIEVELEHTDDTPEGRLLAEEIAKDHLAEQILARQPQDYYTRLARMEEGFHGPKGGGVRPNKTWTRAYMNRLPDSAFLWVGPGGEKDEQNRTHPLHLRSLPYKDQSGKVDLPHLRNAIARLPQTRDIPESDKPRIKKRACSILARHGGECSTMAYQHNPSEDPTEGLSGARVDFYSHYEDDESVPWNAWYERSDGEWWVPRWFSGSEYMGGLVTRSNFRFFEEELADEGPTGWYKYLHGGYGTYGIAVRVDQAPEEFWEVCAALEDYPLASEDLHSQMEIEAQDDAWESYAKREFMQLVERELGYELDRCSDDAVWQAFHDAAESANVYWEDSDEGVYIDLERIVSRMDADDLPDCAMTTEEAERRPTNGYGR
jgi:hypothetical protein